MPYTGLVDSKGRPLSTGVVNKKEAPPATGNAFGQWAGRDVEFLTLPGGALVQFDLSKLTLADYRMMRDHYQINSSLSVLSFMQHQSDFHIECESQKIADHCDEQIRSNWTGLNRAMSQSNWSGYSPNALEWENKGSRIVLSKVKDLIPEECAVNWKTEEGWAPPGQIPPKFKTYDGINQYGSRWPIPVENSFWYPLLMENGDYYGRKLLRPAFQSWFFSLLLHLFSNRYFERFGEPVPIGRAPFDEEIDIDGKSVRGNTYLLKVLQDLRNRSVVVLPSDRTELNNGTSAFDYEIEYLESQMRGADFERYMTRLDEEMSIGMFTPLLLMRTADVGSYNLGVGHMQMYLWMLNAMNDDRKVYIDKYLLRKMVDYNFGTNAPDAKIVYRKLGNSNQDMIKEVITALIQQGRATVNLEELGQMAGMTIEEIKQTTAPTPVPADPNAPAPAPATDPNTPAADPATGSFRRGATSAHAVAKEIVARVRPQIEQAYRSGNFDNLTVSMGFKNKLERAIASDSGTRDAILLTNQVYRSMDTWLESVLHFAKDEIYGPDEFMQFFEGALASTIDGALNGTAS